MTDERSPSFPQVAWSLVAALLVCQGCAPNEITLGGNTDDGGPSDAGSACVDLDGEGVPGSGDCGPIVYDCDDADPTRFPGARELCNGRDDNCDPDGGIDEGLATLSYYEDQDFDGYGGKFLVTDCKPPNVSGWVVQGGDCNDSNPAINPGTPEYCNGIDDNCSADGGIDESVVYLDWYVDKDSDGFGVPDGGFVNDCKPLPGRAPNALDCDDGNPAIKPDAGEVCDDRDNNCNNLIDDGLVFSSYYLDADGDNHGSPSGGAVSSCRPVPGRAANATDCDDTNALINPGAAETCNSLDDDCNNLVDDGLVMTNYYADSDSDGYGAKGTTPTSACKPQAGKVTNATDCNDADAGVHPGAVELCNAYDDDCNNVVDDNDPGGGAFCSTGQPGVCAAGVRHCQSGTLVCVASTQPSPEICDGLDNNCAGGVDEPWPTKGSACDAGTGQCAIVATLICRPDGGGLQCGNNAGVQTPPACDGLDNDCNGQVDERFLQGTATVFSEAAESLELSPYYYSSAAGGCLGGTAGTGTDALTGAVAAFTTAAGGTPLVIVTYDPNGTKVGQNSTIFSAGSANFGYVGVAQTGQGVLVAATHNSKKNVELFLGYLAAPPGNFIYTKGLVGAAGENGALNQLTAATGNTIDSLRVVRGNDSRVTLIWRESGTATATTGLKLAQVVTSNVTSTSNAAIRNAADGAVQIMATTLVPGAIERGIGADSTHWDWVSLETCQPTTTKRRLAIAYLSSPQTLKYFTVDEDGTNKSADVVVQNETGTKVIAEPEVVFYRSGNADQWFIGYLTTDSTGSDLNYWMTTSQSKHSAYAATTPGQSTIARLRGSATSARIQVTAIRTATDPSGYNNQVMFRQLTFAGAKDPVGTYAETPVTSGACGPADCRAGNKVSVVPWAAPGKIIFSTTPSVGTHTATLQCN